jgi:hypothetical protein
MGGGLYQIGPQKGHNSNNAIKGRDAGMINRMINQSEGRIRKHLDERPNTARGSNAHESKGHDFGQISSGYRGGESLYHTNNLTGK